MMQDGNDFAWDKTLQANALRASRRLQRLSQASRTPTILPEAHARMQQRQSQVTLMTTPSTPSTPSAPSAPSGGGGGGYGSGY